VEEGGVTLRDPPRIAPVGMRKTGAAAPVFRSAVHAGAVLALALGLAPPFVVAAPRAVASPPAVELADTQVRTIASTALGRRYDILVGLPEGYAAQPGRRYPVLFVTDANYAFPLVRSIAHMVGDHGHGLEDFVLVGLGYAAGDTPQYSRRRDYTPTPRGDADARSDMPGRAPLHGEAEAYRRFVATEVFPLVAANYRVDMKRKILAGHSYGGLFAAHVLLTEPTMFERYVISSPSLWYDDRVVLRREREYAATHDDLPADVLLEAGSYETLDPVAHDPRYNRSKDMLRDLRLFESRLRAHRYPHLRIETKVVAGEDHLSVFPVAITRGLQWALPAR